MKRMKQKILMTLVFAFSLFAFVGNAWCAVNLPTAILNGQVHTTATDLTFNVYLSRVNYVNEGSYASENGITDNGLNESIINAEMVISGATRSGAMTFNNASLEIRHPGDLFPFLTGTLNNIEFLEVAPGVYYLNLFLDSENPPSLNLTGVDLYTDASHPSRFINELQGELGSTDVLGLKLGFFVSGDITGTGTGTIFDGLLDGVTAGPPNAAPEADAGDNELAVSGEVANTWTIVGIATDADGDELYCRWMEAETILLDWTLVNANQCPLDLGPLSLGLGDHHLTLEVDDGIVEAVSSDTMILTIENSAPHASAAGGGTYQIGTDIPLEGSHVSDYDGEWLDYEWSEGANLFCSGDIEAVAGGDPVTLPDCVLSNLSLGTHIITLTAYDGVNESLPSSIEVNIIDTSSPTLAPIADTNLLWPPNHVMVDIVIEANASDNSGLPVTLSVDPVNPVLSNEPEYGLGDGDTGPDWTLPVIDQSTGTIYLQLRRERSGSGDGRVYTVIVSATDNAGNVSTTGLEIIVPHDKRKK